MTLTCRPIVLLSRSSSVFFWPDYNLPWSNWTFCLQNRFLYHVGSSADRKVYPHQPMMFWRSGLTIERVWIAWESSETCQWTDRLDDFGYKGDEKGCAFFEWGGLDWVNVALLDLRGVIRGRRLVISASLADLNRLNCIVGGKVVSYWSSKGEEQSDWAIVDLYKRVCRLMRDGGRES